MIARDTAIVGRDAELAAIDDFITDPARVALLVEGEPGIGKTTLWLHAARAAELRGHRVLRAEPAER
ncbi:MAG TPA: AAA family ATPase, partial [Gaiellaceae bacterium]|nr:AAA family ATPase [Gaiellaceae bacterium]